MKSKFNWIIITISSFIIISCDSNNNSQKSSQSFVEGFQSNIAFTSYLQNLIGVFQVVEKTNDYVIIMAQEVALITPTYYFYSERPYVLENFERNKSYNSYFNFSHDFIISTTDDEIRAIPFPVDKRDKYALADKMFGFRVSKVSDYTDIFNHIKFVDFQTSAKETILEILNSEKMSGHNPYDFSFLNPKESDETKSNSGSDSREENNYQQIDEPVNPPIESGTGVVEAPKIEEDLDKIFTVVQIPAEFPGGLPAWAKYLERNLNRELLIENGAPPGKYSVVVSFIVAKDGTLSDVVAENDPGYGTKNEAVRVIAKGPKWKPAVQNGRNVNYRHKQSITFMVNQE